jgi:hypothetical protein
MPCSLSKVACMGRPCTTGPDKVLSPDRINPCSIHTTASPVSTPPPSPVLTPPPNTHPGALALVVWCSAATPQLILHRRQLIQLLQDVLLHCRRQPCKAHTQRHRHSSSCCLSLGAVVIITGRSCRGVQGRLCAQQGGCGCCSCVHLLAVGIVRLGCHVQQAPCSVLLVGGGVSVLALHSPCRNRCSMQAQGTVSTSSMQPCSPSLQGFDNYTSAPLCTAKCCRNTWSGCLQRSAIGMLAANTAPTLDA